MLHVVICILHVSGSGSNTSVGEEICVGVCNQQMCKISFPFEKTASKMFPSYFHGAINEMRTTI